MPMPDAMGFSFTPVEIQDIRDHFNGILTIINTKKIVQLTAKERQAAQSASEIRLPYMDNAITNLAVQFPALTPNFVSLPSATADFGTAMEFRELANLRNETNDRMIDFSLAAEHFAYIFMRKYYNSAKEAQEINTPGADVVVNALEPLFEGQGTQNPPVPTP